MTYSDGTNSGSSRRNHYVGQPAVKVGSSNFDYYLSLIHISEPFHIPVHNRAFGGTCFVMFFFKTQRGKQRDCNRTHGCADDMVRCADDIL